DLGAYLVFWASNIYDPEQPLNQRDNNATYNRMMYSVTRDFVNFSTPEIWIDSKRGTGRGMIDSSVIKDGETYYRFTKDEMNMTVMLQKSNDLRANITHTGTAQAFEVTSDPDKWSL